MKKIFSVALAAAFVLNIAGASIDEMRFKKHCLDDPFFFTREVLDYNLLESTIHRPLCNFFAKARTDVLDLEPRDHFKTTCLIGFVIWRIIQEPDIKILYSHKILKRSKEMLSEIKGHFERNRVLLHFFGNHVGEPWGADAITVNRRTAPRKEPTLTVGAVGHEITSGHFNLIINDDLAGLKDMYSEAARAETLRYYKALRYLRDRGNCRELNAATRWHERDVSGYIIENRPEVRVRVKRARLPNGRPYFPQRYSTRDLKELETEDPILYAAQMNNAPVDMVEQFFSPDKLHYFDLESFKPRFNIAFVDPAFGRREGGEPCFLSMCIGSIVGDKVYIIDWPTNRERPESNEILIVDKLIEHKVRRFAVEANAAQSEFLRSIQREMKKRGLVLHAEPINQTQNKARRIEAMHGTVMNKVYFCETWDEVYPEAMRQLITYPSHKFKDAPDALEGLLALAAGSAEPRIRSL